MPSPHTMERQRGIKEAGQQLEVLRERWPLAFPVQAQDVRPLALGIADQIALAMGWSLPYTLSVLRHWKMAAVYCRAVLAHDQRIALDGAPAEGVDPGAKELVGLQPPQAVLGGVGPGAATQDASPARPQPEFSVPPRSTLEKLYKLNQ